VSSPPHRPSPASQRDAHERGAGAEHGTAGERPRCAWASGGGLDPVLVAYHDEEWGTPVSDDRDLFERLALEGFQAGLSWLTILRKRDAFRAAFADFDPAVVARFGPADRERLLADPGIVRNRAKIDATISNAAAFLTVTRQFGAFAAYLAVQVDEPPCPRPPGSTLADLPAATPASKRISRDLADRGFRFVGPTIVYAFMQSVGLVDDHLPGCFRYRG
jgi:DNA-3-methyladenine glycosylase I